MEQLHSLKRRLQTVNDLQAAAALLSWDQSTYMPSGGAAARGRQLATLSRMAHEQLTDDAVGRLLEDLAPLEQSLPYDFDDASLLRVARHDYQRAIQVPSEFIAKLNENAARSYDAWTTARPANDFAVMIPHLERTLALSQEYAGFFPGHAHIADPLIDGVDQGMTVATVRALFSELRRELVPLVQAITAAPPADNRCLFGHFPEAQQVTFGEQVIKRLGYDFARGRQDKTHHPFMTKFSLGDVRITTRFRDDDVSDGLFSTIHETGHALYEQGISQALEGTPLADGTSSGVHESQSRLWENIVGRSRGFWQFFYPQLQATFPAQLNDVSLDQFYRAINRVARSLVRTDADEVTYNLHVMIRFDLETELLEGKLQIKDLPAAWNARYQSDLGLVAPDDRDGVLQDVHWYAGQIGGVFQGYTLGNILSAQFYQCAIAAAPTIPADIARGEFGALHGWLREHVYQHGRKLTPPELVEQATGQPLTIAPYLTYLRKKYGELYAL